MGEMTREKRTSADASADASAWMQMLGVFAGDAGVAARAGECIRLDAGGGAGERAGADVGEEHECWSGGRCRCRRGWRCRRRRRRRRRGMGLQE
jgi:hypothetical protein